MAAVKRKNAPASWQKSGSPPKKFKEEESAKLKPKKSRFTEEAETDSDPIVESDTGSESGEDDGASWPSDSEEEKEGGVEMGADNDAGTMGIATEAAGAMHPARKDINKSSETHYQSDRALVLMCSSKQFERSSCQAEG